MATTPFAEVRESLKRVLGVERLRDGLWKDLVPLTLRRAGRERSLVHRGPPEPVPAQGGGPLRPAQVRRASRCARSTPTRARGRSLRWSPAVWRASVRAFRRTVLNSERLPQSAIAAWVEHHAHEEGPPADRYFSMPVASWREPPPWLFGDDAVAGYARWLADERRASRPTPRPRSRVATSGVPATLLRGPSEPYARSRSAATAYFAQLRTSPRGSAASPIERVVGGPTVAFIFSGGFRRCPGRASRAATVSVARRRSIGLRVDPRLAPRAVALIYGEAREGYAGGADRPMDKKHLGLAVPTERSPRCARPRSSCASAGTLPVRSGATPRRQVRMRGASRLRRARPGCVSPARRGPAGTKGTCSRVRLAR